MTPSSVERNPMPNLHIKSRPIRFIGQFSDTKMECLVTLSSSSHLKGIEQTSVKGTPLDPIVTQVFHCSADAEVVRLHEERN